MGDFAFSTKLLNIISIDIKSKKAGFRPAFYNENLNYITSVGIIASKIPIINAAIIDANNVILMPGTTNWAR